MMQWKSRRRAYEGAAERTTVRMIHRRTTTSNASADPWQPWVVAAESALLARLGVEGLGLYAARPFKRGDRIGKYTGTQVGPVFRTHEDAARSPEVRALVSRGNDKLLATTTANGVVVVDGAAGGLPLLQLANDPRGTKLGANVHVTPHGYMVVRAARIPPFDFRHSLADNLQAELRWSYGDGYWEDP